MLPLRSVEPAQLPSQLAAVVTRLTTLEEVLRRPELTFLDVIVQDEYTHDVVVRTSGAAYLCFDTT